MAKRRQRREKSQVNPAAALGGGVEVLGKCLPVPCDSPVQHFKGNRLDIDEVPRRDFVHPGLAWRDADAAVAHHHGRDAVPRRAGDQGIPTNLRVVMRMRIDESGCDDEVTRIDYFLRAVFDFANFGDAPVLDRDVAMKCGRPGSVDDTSVLDHEIVRHAYLLKSDAADIDAALSVLRTFSPLFSEESYFFLHRTVGKTEQHRLVPGLMVIPFPAWNYENVARTPFEALIADDRAAASFNHREHRTVG